MQSAAQEGSANVLATGFTGLAGFSASRPLAKESGFWAKS
jgi:hypothetical protein